MRLIYLDPCLIKRVGHRAVTAREVRRAATARGIETHVVGNRTMLPDLAEELDARCHFKLTTAHRPPVDPICGAIESFHTVAKDVAGRLARMTALAADDLVFVNSVEAAEFHAVMGWLGRGFTTATRPRLVLEFGHPPGFRPLRDPAGRITGLKQASPWPSFYRWTAKTIQPATAARLRLATFDPRMSDAYGSLLRRPVEALPLPFRAVTDARSRVGTAQPTLAFLGHQRSDKGTLLVPELVERALARWPNVRVLYHDSGAAAAGITTALAGRAAAEPRLSVVTAPAAEPLWRELLSRADLIVMPYDPDPFAIAYSALASEAVANAIPSYPPDEIVTPARGMPGNCEA